MIKKCMGQYFILGVMLFTVQGLYAADDACPAHITPEQLQQAIDKTIK